ncbi:MAG: hypothetical protein U0228_31195 [Myxococcaceae bacterium]
MASKIVSKTDLSKNAIVLNDELSRLLHQRGIFPVLGGGNPHVVYGVRMFLVNTGKDIVVSYYAAVRDGSDRPIEERIWSPELGEAACIGDELNIDFQKNRFVIELRPPAD